MDRTFIYLFVTWAVAIWIPAIIGGDPQVGIAVRQGEPTSVIAQKNEGLLLNCSVEYDSDLGPLTFTWFRNNEEVEIGSRIQVFANGSLYFRRIIHRPRKNRSDEGRYKCLANLAKVGTIIARQVQVNIAGIERKFDIEPSPQVAPVGGVARFQCVIKAVPPATYIWERNQENLPQNNDRYLFLSSGILQITGVQESDEGHYRCCAAQGILDQPGAGSSNIENIDRRCSGEAQLTVDRTAVGSEVKIIANSHNVTVETGVSATLECLVQKPPGTEVIWLKDGSKDAIVLGDRIEMMGTNLHFYQTELGDSGKYHCRAGSQSTETTLNIIQRPVIIKEPNNMNHQLARWIFLKCEVDGFPKPVVDWYHNGKLVVYNDIYRLRPEFELVIVKSEPGYSGYYQCVAKNAAGSASAFVRVNVFMNENAPGRVTNLRATDIAKNEIKIEWDVPKAKKDQPILAYSVTCKEIGTSSQNNKDEVVSDNVLMLKGLKPFTKYAIQVIAFAKVGGGEKSEELIVQTMEGVPQSPVDSITLEPGASNVRVTWDPLPVENRNGIITEYIIYHRKKSSDGQVAPADAVQQEIVSADLLSFMIRGLESRTTYEVRIEAATGQGTGTFPDEKWPWVTFVTRDKTYVIPPRMQISGINRTAVNLTWSYDGDVAVDQFVLDLRVLKGPTVGNDAVTRVLPSGTRNYLLNNLDESSFYSLTLTVILLDGTKAQVVEEFGTSYVPLPLKPKNIHVTERTANSLKVVWFLSEADTAKVTHYTVRYAALSGQTPGPYQYLVRKVQNADLENLDPYTLYTIAVQSHTALGDSSFSSPIIERTQEGVPSEPQDINIQMVKPGYVNINWSPPAVTNGNIKSYVILYTNAPSSQEDAWIKVTKNGTEHSATITISDVSGVIYYFKLQAMTGGGVGKATQPFQVNPQDKPNTGDQRDEDQNSDQRLGIIIGISIGVFCILVCIFIILLRNRCFSANYNQQQPPQTQPARFHGNGHIPGNRNGHAASVPENTHTVGLYEMDALTPMLDNLPENEDSDSKGAGGGNVILTPNGAKLNGFVPIKKNGIRNGQLQNGHMNAILINHCENLDVEETRGLIAAMLGGGTETCMTERMGEESFTRSQYEDIGSLDDIDHSSCEDVLKKSQVSLDTGCRDSGEGDSLGKETSCEDSGEGSLTGSGGDEIGLSRQNSPDVESTSLHRNRNHVCVNGQAVMVPTETGNDTGVLSQRMAASNREEIRPVVVELDSVDSNRCEDTCHDGGTVSGNVPGLSMNSTAPESVCNPSRQQVWRDTDTIDNLQLPQNQLSTSNHSQASVSDVAMATPRDKCGDDGHAVISSSSCGPPQGVCVNPALPTNGIVAGANMGQGNAAALSSSGVPNGQIDSSRPHVYSNGGKTGVPQGEFGLISADNNPIVPH